MTFQALAATADDATIDAAIRKAGRNVRELDGRESCGTRVRLFWLKGTRQVAIRIDDGDRVVQFPVKPERAMEAFRHPWVFAEERAR